MLFVSTQDLTLDNLKRQAAEYFSEIRLPRADWHSLQDIEPLLSEFHLRLDLQDDVTASAILGEISDFLDERGSFQLRLTLATELEQRCTTKDARKTALKAKTGAFWRMGRWKEAIANQRTIVDELAHLIQPVWNLS
jgi:hypothetical protein